MSWIFVKQNAVPWTPSDLSDLRCWLDASDSATITLSGSSVTLWEDKAGSNDADDAVNTSNTKITTARPTIVTSAQNSLDAIGFDGSQWFDHNASRAMLKNRSCAIAAWVGKFGVVSNSQFQGVWTHANGSTARRVYFNHRGANTIGVFSVREDAETNKVVLTSTNPPYNTDWHLHIAFLDWTNGSMEYRVDGSSIGTSSYDSAGQTDNTDLDTTHDTRTAIGSENGRSGGANLSSGSRIGELLCWAKSSGSYSADDVQKVEGYLAHKWGLTANLAASHPYKTVAPTV